MARRSEGAMAKLIRSFPWGFCLAREARRFDAEGPQHYVTVKAFALGKYDVTTEEFLRFLRDSGYQPLPCNPILGETWRSAGHGLAYPPYDVMPPRWPAVCLDWKDANAY